MSDKPTTTPSRLRSLLGPEHSRQKITPKTAAILGRATDSLIIDILTVVEAKFKADKKSSPSSGVTKTKITRSDVENAIAGDEELNNLITHHKKEAGEVICVTTDGGTKSDEDTIAE